MHIKDAIEEAYNSILVTDIPEGQVPSRQSLLGYLGAWKQLHSFGNRVVPDNDVFHLNNNEQLAAAISALNLVAEKLEEQE